MPLDDQNWGAKQELLRTIAMVNAAALEVYQIGRVKERTEDQRHNEIIGTYRWHIASNVVRSDQERLKGSNGSRLTLRDKRGKPGWM